MTGLTIVKTGRTGDNTWQVEITDGPSKGRSVALFRLKREAQAFIDQYDHLPWDQLYETLEAATVKNRLDLPLTTTIPTREAIYQAQRIERLEAEVAHQKAVIWEAHDAIVAWFGYGSVQLSSKIREGTFNPKERNKERNNG